MSKQAFLSIILIFFILISEAFYFYYTKIDKISMADAELKIIGVYEEIKENSIRLDAELSLTYSLSFGCKMKFSIFPLSIPSKASSNIIYIYFDDRYPSFGLGLREWIGLKDHIPIELKKLGFEGKIVNAIELREVMLKEKEACIVIPSGVLPDTVYSMDGGLISSWLKNDGILIWIGYKIGYYIGHEDGGLSMVGDQGQKMLLGYELDIGNLSYWEAIADRWTGFAEGLALSYPHAWMGPNLNAISNHGGITIGGIYTFKEGLEYSSISILPHSSGRGKVILFGGGVGYAGAALGEDSIARDIAKILWSGVFLSNLSFYSYHLPFLPINYTTQWLRGSSEIKFRLSINMLLNDKLHEKFYLVILALPTDFYTDLYLKRMILCDLKVA